MNFEHLTQRGNPFNHAPYWWQNPSKKAFLEIYYLKKHLIYKKLAEKVANTKIYL